MIWQDVKTFLETCTTVDGNNPESISLIAYNAYKDDKNPAVARNIIQEIKKKFGEGETSPVAFDYPDATKWSIQNEDLNKAIEHIISGQPWPKFTFGPIELVINYWYKLIDPATKQILPFQEYQSDLMIWFSRNSCCNADLYFPFTNPDEEFFSYLLKIDHHLPFGLEKRYLKQGRPNKNKTANFYRKIEMPG